MTNRPVITALTTTCLVLLATTARGQPALHSRIDEHITARESGPVSARASDAEFVRRVYLDFVGRIPTRSEAASFLNDPTAAKREPLIDRLIASEEHPQHLARLFHVMLLERLGDHAEWQAWLRESFKSNKPWDQMTREMLAPHLPDDAARGAGLMLAKRLEHYGENPVEYSALVRDVGRLFLGVDLQCAECHDHPQIDDYKQVDFKGLHAFFINVSLLDGSKFPAVSEKPTTKKIDFQSVFLLEQRDVGPRLPFGNEIEIPAISASEEFQILPDKSIGSAGALKFSPLRQLSTLLPQLETKGFAHNIANRLWWVMFGRGLVNPLDQHHGANSPSHPQLLELLASELSAHRFDMRFLLREIALSDTYQRSSVIVEPESNASSVSYRRGPEKGLSPEQFARSLWTATGPWPDEKKLAELNERCVKALAQPPREPETGFNPSVKGALFLSHDRVVLEMLTPQEGNLIDRLTKLGNSAAAAEDIYLSVFSRLPTDDEKLGLDIYLKKHAADLPTAFAQYVWAMLASNEFALNH